MMEKLRNIFNAVRTNYYTSAIWNLLLLTAVYTMSRMFFYFINEPYFDELSTEEFKAICTMGIRFDIYTILLLNIAYILMMTIPLRIRDSRAYRAITKIIFITTNSVGILVNNLDATLVQLHDSRTAHYNVVRWINNEYLGHHITELLTGSWAVAVFAIAMIAMLTMLYTSPRPKHLTESKGTYYLTYSVLFVATIICVITLIHKRIWISLDNCQTTEHAIITINTPFNIIDTFDKIPYVKADTIQTNTFRLDSLMHVIDTTLLPE